MASRKRKRSKRGLLAIFDDIHESVAHEINRTFDLADYPPVQIVPAHSIKNEGKKRKHYDRVFFEYILADEIEANDRLGHWINTHLRKFFTRVFRLNTTIAFLIFGKHTHAETAKDWRTASSTDTPYPAFEQLPHNIGKWVVHGQYDACKGFQFAFRIPSLPKAKRKKPRKKKHKR